MWNFEKKIFWWKVENNYSYDCNHIHPNETNLSNQYPHKELIYHQTKKNITKQLPNAG